MAFPTYGNGNIAIEMKFEKVKIKNGNYWQNAAAAYVDEKRHSMAVNLKYFLEMMRVKCA